MRKHFLIITIIAFAGIFIFISCKKERSCEGCRENNKPPIAIAGPDHVITLPTDSILLDGSASNDPDGTISEWLWKKIEGPASFDIASAAAAKTKLKNLVAGVYQFELKVTDDKGASAKDTMQLTVDAIVTTNHPPVANAGADQTITLPTNTVNLDGNGSTDPDNNITSYAWTKISGPSSFVISNANAVQTQVTNLVQGVYQFELKATDAVGLFDKDTIQVTVNNSLNRPPIANAGADQTIILPLNSITVNGSGSTDPDNNITTYQWIKISGPSSFNISNANAATTQVNNLAEGIYQFELKVADAGGLFDKDTMRVTVNPQPSSPPPCITNCGKIVFVSDRDGNNEIYTCNADGSNVTRMTTDTASDINPAWSPGGTHIAFIRNMNLFIMSADGSNVVQKTFTNDAVNPTWSPDGTRIAFTRYNYPNGQNIIVMDLTNGAVSTIVSTIRWDIIQSAAWSPDGTKIAFDGDWGQGWYIFTISPQGGVSTLLWPQFYLNTRAHRKPSWSPDGMKISVTIWSETYGGCAIGVMNADGTGPIIIKTGIDLSDMERIFVTNTSWSPHGTRIAFTSLNAGSRKDISWVSADGSASGIIITNGWDADWKH